MCAAGAVVRHCSAGCCFRCIFTLSPCTAAAALPDTLYAHRHKPRCCLPPCVTYLVMFMSSVCPLSRVSAGPCWKPLGSRLTLGSTWYLRMSARRPVLALLRFASKGLKAALSGTSMVTGWPSNWLRMLALPTTSLAEIQ